MSELSLPAKVIAIHEALAKAKIAHAFGGALALAYYAEPRATDDIDINLFVAPTDFPLVRKVLTPLGLDEDQLELAVIERDGQCRVWWGRTPLDLFFAYDEIHEAMGREVRLQPFADQRLPILSPEHLVTCKAIFDRAKDWMDIEQVLVCVELLDVAEIRMWLDRIVGVEDPRRERFDRIAETVLDQRR
jgi:hypothetical protein